MADYINALTWTQDATDTHVFRALVTDSASMISQIAVLMAMTHERYRWMLYSGSTLDSAPHPYSVATNLIYRFGENDTAEGALAELNIALSELDMMVAEQKGVEHGASKIKTLLGI